MNRRGLLGGLMMHDTTLADTLAREMGVYPVAYGMDQLTHGWAEIGRSHQHRSTWYLQQRRWDYHLDAEGMDTLRLAMADGAVTTVQVRGPDGAWLLLAGRVPEQYRERCRVVMVAA